MYIWTISTLDDHEVQSRYVLQSNGVKSKETDEDLAYWRQDNQLVHTFHHLVMRKRALRLDDVDFLKNGTDILQITWEKDETAQNDGHTNNMNGQTDRYTSCYIAHSSLWITRWSATEWNVQKK